MKNKKALIIYLIICIFIFIKVFNFINAPLEEEYSKNFNKETLKNEIIETLNNNQESRDLLAKEYGIKSEEDITNAKLDEIMSLSQKVRNIFVGVLSLGAALLFTTILFIPVFIFQSVRKKYHKYRLSNDQFIANKDYYRDLLKGYTPLELSYNNNYKIDQYALIATVLNMENKKIITYKDNKFYVKKDTSNLSTIEKSIADSIGDNGVDKIIISNFGLYSDIINVCKEKKLIELGNISKKKLIKDIVISIIVYIVIYFLWKKSEVFLNDVLLNNNVILASINSALLPVVSFALFAFVHLYPVYFIIKYLVLNTLINRKSYKKTDLGKEINYKLEGLKNFIRDFSILNEREKEEVIIWDEYLVYSVMFNDNNKIIEEYKNKVQLKL